MITDNLYNSTPADSETAFSALAKSSVTRVIRQRRSIYADEFLEKEIPQSVVEEILTNATWAPTHKMTEPWRFIVLQGSQQQKFGSFMADYYKSYYDSRLSEEDSLLRYKYLLKYPLNASCMVAIILVRHPKIALPEWEELAAVSCAVQNMALSCTAQGLGGYWSSTDAAIAYVQQLGLAENEQSLGLFFMGYQDPEQPVTRKKRSTLDKKVSWLS